MSLDVRSTVGSGEDVTGWQILRRGFALSPALREGLGVTLLLGAASTLGSVIVPVVIQKTIDDGLLGSGGIDRSKVWTYTWIAAGVVLVTAVAAYWMRVRLYRASESGLAELRIKAFRHVHDLPVLTQDRRMLRLQDEARTGEPYAIGPLDVLARAIWRHANGEVVAEETRELEMWL